MTSENAKEGKYAEMLGWKDQNKTADKPDNAIWREKSKDGRLKKILWQGQAIQTKPDLPK